MKDPAFRADRAQMSERGCFQSLPPPEDKSLADGIVSGTIPSLLDDEGSEGEEDEDESND